MEIKPKEENLNIVSTCSFSEEEEEVFEIH
jgi:hypothetical protein